MAIDLRNGTVTGLLVLPRAFSVTSNTVGFLLEVNSMSYASQARGRRLGLVWTSS